VGSNRRDFLKQASLGAFALASGRILPSHGADEQKGAQHTSPPAYKYRIAFGCWINDMRSQSLPLQGWPAPQLDEETVASAIRAMDVQSRAGFNYLDAWGLFATYGYPPDIASAFADKDRSPQVHRLIKAASERGMKYLFGMGLFSWGYDQIVKADPAVQGRSKAGQPLAHVMCGAKDKAWAYVQKILDLALSEFEFSGVHLESADLGWCDCPECGAKDGVVGYNCRLNMRAADYIKQKWPGKIVTCIPINWIGGSGRWHFNEAEQAHVVELSKHIDCFMDQGWTGTYIPDDARQAFIRRLHCDYGTSGGLWVYHTVRWDRSSYFLPYAQRTARAIKRHFDDGARGCMFYQGPVVNPGIELNVAVGGRILSDTRRSVEEALAEAIDLYYKPKGPAALKALVDLMLRAEEAYFGQWDPKAFAAQGRPMPGELHLTDLFGSTPGPAHYLLEPFLSAEGRRAYKRQLVALLKDLERLDGQCADDGRLERIRKGMAFTLNLLDTVRCAKGEPLSSEG